MSTAALTKLPKDGDPVLRSTITLNRDLDTYYQLRHSIKSGDVGHMEHLIPTLLLMFKGANHGNYAQLMLNLINFKKYKAPSGV